MPKTIGLLWSRQWWWTTLLVIAAIGVMARLGLWQLDRMVERQAFNARVRAQLEQPPLELTPANLNLDLTEMEYRSVVVVGRYDHSQQVALRNQVWNNQPGVHLLTPLVIENSNQAVLVDRGWIPADESAPEKWDKFEEPGVVEVRGIIRRSRTHPDFGGVPDPVPPPGERLLLWNLVNLDRIGSQTSHPLLPIYIQQSPDPAWTSLPYRYQPELDLSDGPHLGYALQWFAFAAVLGIGYLNYIRQQTSQDVTAQAVESSLPESAQA